jgi:putative transposase
VTNGRLYKQDHATYQCEYHLVWTPKYRGRVMVSEYIKLEFKRMFKMICQWKGFVLYGIHVGDEHIHLYLGIPPKFSVAFAISILKSKSSAWIKKKNKKIPQGSFWARGYFASTVGINEYAIRKYIANQNQYKSEQLQLEL